MTSTEKKNYKKTQYKTSKKKTGMKKMVKDKSLEILTCLMNIQKELGKMQKINDEMMQETKQEINTEPIHKQVFAIMKALGKDATIENVRKLISPEATDEEMYNTLAKIIKLMELIELFKKNDAKPR